ncbi:MAG: LysE/ArgO family amino acid transporter [Primorskyibacter sp.]
MVAAFLTGLGLSLSLIVAIGAQNAFVLRQGLRGEHVFAVCLFCALSDMVLIAAGVTGFGAMSRALPGFELAMRWGGAAFLVWYGLRSLRDALRGGQVLQPGDGAKAPLGATLAVVAGVTWLNPHTYLDTVVLIGSVSAGYPAWPFGIGAVAGSVAYFFALGYGARLLRPIFAKPLSWQILDATIAMTMWAIAVSLVV